MGGLRIVSHGSGVFSDRKDAGRLLADELEYLKGKEVVVLGILRGGIIIAREIAIRIGAELDIVLSRKISAPMDPELAIGAVSESGKLFINKKTASYTGADNTYIQEEKKRQVAEIKRRSKLFRKIRPKISLERKEVIMTDDGLATGATMQAALWAARQEHPEKLIAAVPVGPEETLEELTRDADEVICLKAPYPFNAVGQFYLQFEQIEDKKVLSMLKEYNKNKGEEYKYGSA